MGFTQENLNYFQNTVLTDLYLRFMFSLSRGKTLKTEYYINKRIFLLNDLRQQSADCEVSTQLDQLIFTCGLKSALQFVKNIRFAKYSYLL